MIQAQVRTTADGAIVYDAALGATPDPEWFDATHWPRLGDAPAGRGGVAFVATSVGACALRHYRRGGLAAHVSRDRYLFTGAERTRAFREFRLLARLADAGLPVAEPVAAGYRREGLRYRADLMTRRVADAEPLSASFARGLPSTAVAEEVGRTLGRFHAAGAWHADLNAHNLLVGRDGRVTLIDFDRGRVRRPALAWQQANIGRLLRSLAKIGACSRAGFHAGFWHPMLAAYHDALAAPQTGLSRSVG